MTRSIDHTTIEDTFAIVTAVLVETLSLAPDEVVPAADLREDLGLDSLDLLELMSTIEAHVGRPVDDSDIKTVHTVADAVTLIQRLQNQGADR